jgi:uncharacterized protein (DUF1800 family)
MSEVESVLDILARSPATAHHLSFELAQYFVADDPPPALVERMTQRYLSSDGDITAVLTTLFHSPEFWDRQYFATKFKTPLQYVLSAVRATGVKPINFRPMAGQLALLGMPIYGCQTPDGYKSTQAAWLNPDAMMRRLSFATGLGSGHLPLDQLPPPEPDPDKEITAAIEHPVVGHMTPPDPDQLAQTVGNQFSAQTAAAVQKSPAQLRAALILGSPEFMRH